MTRLVVLLLCFMPLFSNANELLKLYEQENKVAYEDLVIRVKGYEVPTRMAFRGWVLMNQAEPQVRAIADKLFASGVKEIPLQTMPLHLILLQGTNWKLNGTSIFTMPGTKQVHRMVKTVKFIQTHIEPAVGPLVPVSGDRDQYYNQTSGGATRSQHLNFCALDLVPINDISREDLHKKLWEIYWSVGRENNMGMGLYSGVRFHIDTCGYRNW